MLDPMLSILVLWVNKICISPPSVGVGMNAFNLHFSCWPTFADVSFESSAHGGCAGEVTFQNRVKVIQVT